MYKYSKVLLVCVYIKKKTIKHQPTKLLLTPSIKFNPFNKMIMHKDVKKILNILTFKYLSIKKISVFKIVTSRKLTKVTINTTCINNLNLGLNFGSVSEK